MIQFKSKFYRVLLIIYSFLSIGSTIYLLFHSSGRETDLRYDKTQQELKHIKQYLHEKDAGYEKTIDSLLKKGDSLQSVIQTTDKRLLYSRSQANILSGQLNEYVQRFETDTSLKKDAPAFDTLSKISIEYVRSSELQDSLCDAQILSLKELVSVKENQFKDCDSLLEDYKSSVEQLLLSSNQLNEKLQSTEKKLKRKSQFNKVISVAAVFLSGILVSNYLKPH